MFATYLYVHLHMFTTGLIEFKLLMQYATINIADDIDN